MSITDELRTEARGFGDYIYTSEQAHRLLAIADRIDAEHESKVGCTADEWDYWESTHIELPKDANGECIRVRDVMDGYGKTIEVVELRIGRSGWVIVSRDGNAYADTFAFTHHKQTTVEDVLEEMYDALEDARIPNGGEKRTYEEIIAEYAAKLQLRGEGE